jgi:adenylosuccinate lyase
MKAEPLLAKLNELRHEAEGDPTDVEWLALHHAFCFLSYRMAEFQKYLDQAAADAAPPEDR